MLGALRPDAPVFGALGGFPQPWVLSLLQSCVGAGYAVKSGGEMPVISATTAGMRLMREGGRGAQILMPAPLPLQGKGGGGEGRRGKGRRRRRRQGSRGEGGRARTGAKGAGGGG